MDSVSEACAVSLYRPKLTDLSAFLPYACRQLEAPFHLRIVGETLEEYVSNADDKSKRARKDKVMPPAQPSPDECSAAAEASPAEQAHVDETEVLLRARCDSLGSPVELLFYRCVQVPRLLMKIIGLCVPYHERLTKITIRWGPLDGSVVYEIAKFLPSSQVTDINLDDSPVPHRNYHLLLERPSRLRSLSLARCGLGDAACAALAARLAHPLPAAGTLALLCLQSNRIGDEGARALGEALRTNRSLRHLNLAGNAITSLGAAHIFYSLMPFSVSDDDMISKRRRIFEYLKLRRDAYSRCYHELLKLSEHASESGRGRRRTLGPRSRRASATTLLSVKDSNVGTLASRAEAMADEAVGQRADPFDCAELVRRGDAEYCSGNFCLSYLNLAYNDLDCTSVGRLAQVLAYQAGAAMEGAGRSAGPGLLRAVLEGNALPAECESLRGAELLLERALARLGPQLLVKVGRKSDRPKLKGY